MDQVLERLSSNARVAVIRLRSLGDCVLTTPALSLLKQARPDLEVAVVVEDSFAPLFAGNSDIDHILAPSAGELSRWRPDLTLNLHGGTRSVQLTVATRSAIRAGFAHFRFQAVYNVRIPRAQEILGCERKVHTAEHLASAMFYLGVPVQEIPRARLVASGREENGPYAVLHPVAAAPEKTWPAANFLELAAHIERDPGLEPVFIGGPGEDLSAFRRYRTISGARLEDIKRLLSCAALFIGNDSGPAHMAAAFGLPVVVMFGPSDPEIWHPWKTESAVLADRQSIANIPVSDARGAVEKLALLSRQPQ